jgi:hypothetical protein
MSDFAKGHIAYGVTSQLPIFVSHSLSAFLRVIFLVVSLIQLTAITFWILGFLPQFS